MAEVELNGVCLISHKRQNAWNFSKPQKRDLGIQFCQTKGESATST